MNFLLTEIPEALVIFNLLIPLYYIAIYIRNKIKFTETKVKDNNHNLIMALCYGIGGIFFGFLMLLNFTLFSFVNIIRAIKLLKRMKNEFSNS